MSAGRYCLHVLKFASTLLKLNLLNWIQFYQQCPVGLSGCKIGSENTRRMLCDFRDILSNYSLNLKDVFFSLSTHPVKGPEPSASVSLGLKYIHTKDVNLPWGVTNLKFKQSQDIAYRTHRTRCDASVAPAHFLWDVSEQNQRHCGILGDQGLTSDM